jgi:hypothetical protein
MQKEEYYIKSRGNYFCIEPKSNQIKLYRETLGNLYEFRNQQMNMITIKSYHRSFK